MENTSNPLEKLKYFAEMKAHLKEMAPVFLEKAPDGLVVIDKNGNICLVNERTEFIFGYDRSELEGQKVHMLLPEMLQAKHVEHITKYFNYPSVREMGADLILKGVSKAKEEFSIKISLSPATTTQGVFAAAWIRRI